jgi:hypothetical protein
VHGRSWGSNAGNGVRRNSADESERGDSRSSDFCNIPSDFVKGIPRPALGIFIDLERADYPFA